MTDLHSQTSLPTHCGGLLRNSRQTTCVRSMRVLRGEMIAKLQKSTFRPNWVHLCLCCAGPAISAGSGRGLVAGGPALSAPGASLRLLPAVLLGLAVFLASRFVLTCTALPACLHHDLQFTHHHEPLLQREGRHKCAHVRMRASCAAAACESARQCGIHRGGFLLQPRGVMFAGRTTIPYRLGCSSWN